MNVLNLLVDLNSVILIVLVANVFKPFIGSYAARKGENLATKEDIAQLTKIAEGIRAEISDKVWDRQKQWKLKRDAIADVIRDMTRLVHANEGPEGLVATFMCSNHQDSSTQPNSSDTPGQQNASNRFSLRLEKLESAVSIAELYVGKDLRSAMSKCYSAFRMECATITNNNRDHFSRDSEDRAIKIYDFREIARKELGIHDAELTTNK
jgi:hypothetical protein